MPWPICPFMRRNKLNHAMPYIEVELYAGVYARVEKAAAVLGMSMSEYLHYAVDEYCSEKIKGAMIPRPAAAPAYAPPAYPAPLAGVGAPVYQMPYPARPGASGQAGEIERLRQMVAVKRSIDAELVSFAERVIMGV